MKRNNKDGAKMEEENEHKGPYIIGE